MFSKTKIFVSILTITSLIFLSGCKSSGGNYSLELEVWGVFDDGNAYSEIFSKYNAANKSVGEIKYKKFTIDTYKDDLLNALASGQGPDIFMISSSWLPSFKDKIEVAPDFILGEQEFRNNFVDVVADDFMNEGKPYAVPLSVDSLALYYNKDLLNAEGIVSPPKTWEEFNEDIKRLRRIDSMGNITQAGAALGTTKNINRPIDILSLLMLQNEVQMTNQEGLATFDSNVMVNGKSEKAGEKAWTFYTDFARIGSPVYTWNNSLHYSIDSFFEGTTAMMLSYAYNIDTIRSKNAKLNFAISPVPQYPEKNPIDYANYWGFAVAKNKIASSGKNSKVAPVSNEVRVREAWEFIKIMTTQNNGKISLANMTTGAKKDVSFNFDPAKYYIDETKKPAARRDLIEKQKTDPFLGPFAYGNLIARSWRQSDPDQIETILSEAIDSINKGNATIAEALRLASTRVSRLVRN